MKAITVAIHRQLKKWDKKGYGAMSINMGMCDSFAQELQEKFPDGRAMWGDEIPNKFPKDFDASGHYFFRYKGMFYDSECPQGCKTPMELPYYVRVRTHVWG